MFALIAALAFAAAPVFAEEQKATFNIHPLDHEDLCLSVKNTTNGAGLKLSNCTDGAGVAYTYSTETATLLAVGEKDQNGNDVTSDYCIDITDGKAHNGNLLQHWICAEGNDNQKYDFVPVEGKEDKNVYSIKWANQDYCFDVKDGNFAPGADVQIWRCVPSNTNQQWIVSNIADLNCDGSTDGSLEVYTSDAKKLAERAQQKRGLDGHRRRTIF